MDVRATFTVTAALVVLAACTSGNPASSATPNPTVPPTSPATTAPTTSPATTTPTPTNSGLTISGKYNVDGRELFIDCAGSGSPTFVIEPGEGQVSTEMADLKSSLSESHLVCSYDRANHGRSGSAPKPRTAMEIVTDLDALLAAAAVPGPYVLVGHSAGGMFVQLFARTFASQTAGVLVMNPVPPCEQWIDRAYPAMTVKERAAESAYYAGGNGEPVDYCASSTQIDDAPAPPTVPFEMLISTIAQCDSADDICGRTYPAYETVMREVAEAWPDGTFSQIASSHSIYVDRLDVVLTTIDRLLDRIE